MGKMYNIEGNPIVEGNILALKTINS